MFVMAFFGVCLALILFCIGAGDMARERLTGTRIPPRGVMGPSPGSRRGFFLTGMTRPPTHSQRSVCDSPDSKKPRFPEALSVETEATTSSSSFCSCSCNRN